MHWRDVKRPQDHLAKTFLRWPLKAKTRQGACRNRLMAAQPTRSLKSESRRWVFRISPTKPFISRNRLTQCATHVTPLSTRALQLPLLRLSREATELEVRYSESLPQRLSRNPWALLPPSTSTHSRFSLSNRPTSDSKTGRPRARRTWRLRLERDRLLLNPRLRNSL